MSTINVTNLSGRGGATPNLPDGANITGVATATSFDGKSTHDAYFNFTDDFKKASATYGRGFKYTAKKQNVVFSSSLVSYQTFQGWDWLGSVSYSKSLIKSSK